MEINVETAVRICPISYNNGDVLCVQPNVYNNTIQLGNSQTFPVRYALPTDCTQNTLFGTAVTPLINYLFEGCDVSIVTFGQSRTGKSYTLLGPGLNCALSETEYGIIPRFLREVFSQICQNNEKHYLIHVTWTQICGENVQDLLGGGSVECKNVSDAFELLQLGMSNVAGQCAHTLFTITLEQQWFAEATMQHRISTASFVDLSSCEKVLVMDNNRLTQSVPTDMGLLTLQKCIWALSEPCLSIFNSHGAIPYNQSALTMLLKDSFGGRAKTLLICCVSPLLGDFMETYYTLQFAMRAQMVKNFVTVNSYTTFEMAYENADVFGLQFATNQLFKLVTNAEDLFKNLMLNSSLSKSQMEQISQWITLKQECEDCISESSEPHRSLDIIEEEIEDSSESTSEESEIVGEDDAQSSLQRFDELMQKFHLKTDGLISTINKRTLFTGNTKESNNSCNSEYHLKGARGRRGSIHSAEEFVPLTNAAKVPEDIQSDQNITLKKSDMSYKVKQKILKQICTEIEGCEKQMNELELTIQMKESLMQQLLRHKNSKITARNRLKQKYQKLQNDQCVAHSKLLQAKSENNQYMEHKYDLEISELTQKLQEAELVKDIADDGTKTIAELESSLQTSKKQLEKLRKHKRKEEKRKLNFESELRHDKKCQSQNLDSSKNTASRAKSNVSVTKSDPEKPCSHSYAVNKFAEEMCNEELASLKHEIKELRKTRDYLLEQRCRMDTKSHNRRLLNEVEEHQLLQCEEAIEAIDLAIEYKNQMICGCTKLTEYNADKQEDKIDKMLMEQFMKLSTNEIRVLLQKYFEKAIDLRSSSKKLEHQVIEVEAQNENLLCQIRNLSHVLQRVRTEAERRILSLQQQHEDKLQLMLHHLSNEGIDSDRVMSRVVERSKQAALALQVAQGAGKQMDKGSLIARFTRYARHETVPRQLQAAITPSQAKVTRQKNKLIIQQNNK